MLAETAFERRAKALAGQLASARSAQEAAEACTMAIEQTACELAREEQDEQARQRQQAVMALCKGAPLMLLCVQPRGRLVLKESAGGESRWLSAARAAGGALMLATAAVELAAGRPLLAAAQALGAALMLLAARSAQMQPGVAAEGEWAIDAQATVARVAALMRATDICTGDLALLMHEGCARLTGEADEATLDLLAALLEARNTGRDEAAMRSLNQVEQHLHALGIEAVGYDEERAAMFDTLPTLGQTRTIRPALLREGRVIRRGVAARREADTR